MAPFGTQDRLASRLALESQSTPHHLAAQAAPREVVRCAHCKLVQFRSPSANCKRCKQSVEIEKPAPAPAPLTLVPAAPSADQGLQVAHAVRELRQVRNLSQRQLAGRMGVPRTYISKIENGKAMPTLSSLDRLARALEVDMSALLRDAGRRHTEESAMLMTDPFLAELATYTARLSSVQRAIVLNQVRELAAGRRRTA